MKTTILKASIQLATQISDDLLSRRLESKPDKALFLRRELDNGGFEVYGYTKVEGKKVEAVVLKFTTKPAARIDYDDRLVTIH